MNEENQFECEVYVGGGEEWDEKKTYTLHSWASSMGHYENLVVEGHWVYDLISILPAMLIMLVGSPK